MKKDKCPNCNIRAGHQETNRIVMTLLGNLEFKCTKCEKPFKYNNAKEHYIKDCEATKLKP